jgi:hypothetical protein
MTATAMRIVGITIETECQRCGRCLRLTVPPEDVPALHGHGALCGGCEADEVDGSVSPRAPRPDGGSARPCDNDRGRASARESRDAQ